MCDSCTLCQIGFSMVSSYPLPEGFSEFDVFSLGSCLLVEGECLGFVLEFGQILQVLHQLMVMLTYDRTGRQLATDFDVAGVLLFKLPN